ncbi:MAG TPA: sulfotransferase domain-containing protein, partial [Solirubrobacteraceae bacterium]|nr:sulfotransferase domain-containing protein [Solirubrobacteraceae bacterium]
KVNERWPQVLMYTDRVRYVDQLRRYHAVFPPEQVLVLIYDDLRSDNEGKVRAVQRFLGVDDTVPVQETEVNPTIRRRVRLDQTLRTVLTGRGSAVRALRSAVKLVTPKRLRAEALSAVQRNMLFGRPRPTDEGLMLELRRRFKPEVQALGEYLDRDLVTLWGYEDLG